MRSEFARPARAEPRIGRDLVTFLGTASQFKTRAEYALGSTAAPISSGEAAVVIATTIRFIDIIAQLLPQAFAPPTGTRAPP